ncbi:MAG TPA: translation initiation factor IF-2 [Clostridiaceae bacterium]|nr:translation initiation factor IF-2 [Clostridiaceae bacterium]
MSKLRVYELAKQLGVASRDIIEFLREFNFNVKNHMSVVNDEAIKLASEYFDDKKEDKKEDKASDTLEQDNDLEGLEEIAPLGKVPIKDEKAKKVSNKQVKRKNTKKTDFKVKVQTAEKEESNKEIYIRDGITVKELSEKLGKQVSEVIKKLIMMGIMANINHELDFDTAEKIAKEYKITVKKEEPKSIEETIIDDAPDKKDDLVPRPPVVTIMGHVDHGKTSLLDIIRKSHITLTEAGGITQHIGAYTVNIKGNKITFFDTPGHEAFTSMRARGAQATDISVLVVAADDGVMPQTIEAINHSKAANVPIIVAINKIDKPNANVDRVKQELAEQGLVAEDWGGDTICVLVSAKTGEGIDNLLEMILLVAEMSELKANPNRLANGVVIESKLDKGRGPVATVLIKNGTLKVGDHIVAGVTYGKVRAMFDDKGKSVRSAGPSIPVEVLGFSEIPDAGDIMNAVKSEKGAKQIAEKRIAANRDRMINDPHRVTLENLFDQIEEGEIKELNIIIKGDVQGSVEALEQSLEKLSNENVKVKVIHGGVGAITEYDVMLASASNAVIIGFNVRPDTKSRLLAEKEKVDIKTYRIIYEVIDDVEAAMKGMLEPEFKEVVRGRAEVRAIFKVSSIGTIAGCYVTEGKINRSNNIRVIRDGIVINEGKLASLKRFKDDVKEVSQGYECGLNVEKFNDIKEGDVIESFEMEQVERTE